MAVRNLFSLENFLDEYSNEPVKTRQETDAYFDFEAICSLVEKKLDIDWNDADDASKQLKLEREKSAIIGYEKDVLFYKDKIREILRQNKLEEASFPSYYQDIIEAIFAELYGLAGISPWAYDTDDKYKTSSSAKIIGERIYFLIDGKSKLMPQRISKDRLLKLKRALLLATPSERLSDAYHEVYLRNGIRISIYSGDVVKPNQDVIVFRKYVMQKLCFEALSERKTFPKEAIRIFELMRKVGFNVIFTGQVRSGKTTFLQTWQSGENPNLEGLAISTDPETPWQDIMPDTALMQIVTDGLGLETLSKSLLRADNDYVLMEEMRDASAYKLILDIITSGTSRCKATVHDGSALDLPYRMASEVVNKYGGSLIYTIKRIYTGFDYVFEMTQDNNNHDHKILKAIVEYNFDSERECCIATYLCKYDFSRKEWRWNSDCIMSKLEKYPQGSKEIIEIKGLVDKLSCKDVFDDWRFEPNYRD